MGLDPPALVTGLALPHVLAVADGGRDGGGDDYVLSARFPIGLARQLDPDLGYHLQPGYLLAAVVVALVVTTAMAVGASWLTTRAALRRGRVRRTRVVGAASRAGASVPAAVGASLALEQAGGRRGAVPVRSAARGRDRGGARRRRGDDPRGRDQRRPPRPVALRPHVEAGGRTDDADHVLHPPTVAGLADMALVSRFAATVHGKDVPFYALDQVKGVGALRRAPRSPAGR